ncbi:hypothetical protein [Clavibacter zhangzhiyongii]|uniref:hypothetical protein n=1 Tax=Clavibacter zhangzhiyongii TaxID=2768071 RepID=UPI0039E1DD83
MFALNKRAGITAAIAALAFSLMVPTAANAAATTTGLAPELVSSLQATWSANGVSADTQKTLVSTLERGVPLDAMKGGEPVATDVSTDGNTQTQVQRYPDGSINIVSLPVNTPPATDQFSTDAIDHCRVQGFRRDNCTVSGWFTGVQLAFNATYVLGTGTGRILSYANPSVTCSIGLNCTSPTFTVTRAHQDGDLAADVGLYTNYSFVDIGGSGTTYLHLLVRDRDAHTN